MPPFPEITIRAAERRDAAALARAWVDAGRFYERVDAAAFQVPDAPGLEEWIASWLEDDAGVTLVAEVGGEVAGFVSAQLLEPEPDARFQLQREFASRRLAIGALAV